MDHAFWIFKLFDQRNNGGALSSASHNVHDSSLVSSVDEMLSNRCRWLRGGQHGPTNSSCHKRLLVQSLRAKKKALHTTCWKCKCRNNIQWRACGWIKRQHYSCFLLLFKHEYRSMLPCEHRSTLHCGSALFCFVLFWQMHHDSGALQKQGTAFWSGMEKSTFHRT